MKRWLPAFSVHRPVTTMMLFIAALVLSTIAFLRIPLEMMPSGFVLNKLWIWVPYPNSTPRENEAQLVRPLEEQLATAPGIAGMTSQARSGNAQIQLDFHRSTSMDVAYNAVVDRIERTLPELPSDVRDYYIYKWDPAEEPVVWAGISIPAAVEDPHQLATEVIQRRLERVPGVGRVEIWGTDPRAVFIDFHLDRLATAGVNLAEVIGALSADNFQMASGRIEDRGRVRYVRSLARYETVDELRRYPLREGLVLGDVAEVTLRRARNTTIAHIDGQEGAALAINKESSANTVEVTRAVDAAMRELEGDARLKGSRFVTFFDQGKMIQDSIANLIESTLTGGLCAVIILYVFLRDLRLTFLISSTIPFTLFATVAVLWLRGGTLNLLSLLGLMLGVGMVVDNAIVVVEAIATRRQQGEGARQAAVEGTSEVNLAITLSTATSMVVFLPVILMSGDADFSFFMAELGMPVVWSMGLSLVASLLFMPGATVWLQQSGPPAAEPAWLTRLTGLYARWLERVLARRTDTLFSTVAIIFLTFVVPFRSVGCEDSDGNIGEFVIRFSVPSTFTYKERAAVVKVYEDFVTEHREAWGVRTFRSQLGSNSTWGQVYVYLEEEPPEGVPPREEVVDQAQKELPQRPGVEAAIGWGGGEGQPQDQLKLNLRGEDTETLEALAGDVTRVLRHMPGVIGVRSDLEESGGEEIRLRADREALVRYGHTATSVGRTVAFALRGVPLDPFHMGDEEVEMQAGFRLEDRQDLTRLLDFPMYSATTDGSVPLRSLVKPEVGRGVGTIRREDRITAWPLTVDFAPDLPQGAGAAAVLAALDSVDFPRGYGHDFGRWEMDQASEDQALLQALVLSLVFVFVIMGVLFESVLLPVAVLTSIPMALIGVYWALFLTGSPLDAMGGVGLIILMGVVVNNGIVLIELVTRLRHEGYSREAALVEAGRRRLRPILMTALTTIVGLIPMAAGSATFVGIPYAPLGRVLGGGMITGTVLTLLFVPFMYTVLDDMRGTSARWLAWWVVRRAEDRPSAVEPR